MRLQIVNRQARASGVNAVDSCARVPLAAALSRQCFSKSCGKTLAAQSRRQWHPHRIVSSRGSYPVPSLASCRVEKDLNRRVQS